MDEENGSYSGSKTWNDLPYEVLLHILSFLSFHDRHQNLARVSKDFLTLSRDKKSRLDSLNLVIEEDGWANFNVDLLSLHKDVKRVEITWKPTQCQQQEQPKEDLIDQWLYQVMTNQHYVQFQQQDWNNPARLSVLERKFRPLLQHGGITHLTLNNFKDPKILMKLPTDMLHSLKGLDLTKCSFYDGNMNGHLELILATILNNCPELEEVRLEEMTRRMLVNLLMSHKTKLRVLSVKEIKRSNSSLIRRQLWYSMYPTLIRARRQVKNPLFDHLIIYLSTYNLLIAAAFRAIH